MVLDIVWPVLLFCGGVVGVLFSRMNLLVALMSLEVAILGVNIFILYVTVSFNIVDGMLFAIVMLLIGAAETAAGLALLINTYKTRW